VGGGRTVRGEVEDVPGVGVRPAVAVSEEASSIAAGCADEVGFEIG